MNTASNSEARKRAAESIQIVTDIHARREAAITVMALALDDHWGGRYQPHAVDELHDEMGAVLDALFNARLIDFRRNEARA